MKKNMKILIIAAIICVSIICSLFIVHAAPEPGIETTAEYQLTEGELTLEPGDTRIIMLSGEAIAIIPPEYKGTLIIRGATIKLPNDVSFTGQGIYKNGELILEDGTFDGQGRTFTGTGAYKPGTGRLKINRGDIDGVHVSSPGKGATYELATGKLMGAATIKTPDGEVIKTSRHITYQHGGVRAFSGKVGKVQYKTPEGRTFTFALEGKNNKWLDLGVKRRPDSVVVTNNGIREFQPSKSIAIKSIEVDGIAYNNIVDLGRGYQWKLGPMGDKEVGPEPGLLRLRARTHMTSIEPRHERVRDIPYPDRGEQYSPPVDIDLVDSFELNIHPDGSHGLVYTTDTEDTTFHVEGQHRQEVLAPGQERWTRQEPSLELNPKVQAGLQFKTTKSPRARAVMIHPGQKNPFGMDPETGIVWELPNDAPLETDTYVAAIPAGEYQRRMRETMGKTVPIPEGSSLHEPFHNYEILLSDARYTEHPDDYDSVIAELEGLMAQGFDTRKDRERPRKINLRTELKQLRKEQARVRKAWEAGEPEPEDIPLDDFPEQVPAPVPQDIPYEAQEPLVASTTPQPRQELPVVPEDDTYDRFRALQDIALSSQRQDDYQAAIAELELLITWGVDVESNKGQIAALRIQQGQARKRYGDVVPAAEPEFDFSDPEPEEPLVASVTPTPEVITHEVTFDSLDISAIPSPYAEYRRLRDHARNTKKPSDFDKAIAALSNLAEVGIDPKKNKKRIIILKREKLRASKPIASRTRKPRPKVTVLRLEEKNKDLARLMDDLLEDT